VLPRRLQIEFSRVVQATTDTTGKELSSRELWELFSSEYLSNEGPIVYRSHQLTTSGDGADRERMTLQVQDGGGLINLHGSGTGPIDAAVRALGLPIDVVGYGEHSVGTGSDALAVAYVEVSTSTGAVFFGVGRHSNIITASLLALVSGVNRATRAGAVTRDLAVTTGT
jgi:2-isopropylmalate synthase